MNENLKEDISISDALNMKSEDAISKLAEWIDCDCSEAISSDQLSLYHNLDKEFTYKHFGDQEFFVKDQRSYASVLLDHLVDSIGRNNIILNQKVCEIEYSEKESVQVTLSDGSTLNANLVISTVSLGVLQNGNIRFSPELPPWKVQALQQIKMAAFVKIFCKF